MRTLFASLLFAVMPAHAAPVFIGTSTGGKSASKGIYRADFDAETGKLSTPVLAAEYGNPNFLALHPEKPILYAVGKPREAYEDGTDSVAVFAISEDYELRFLGEISSRGTSACHLVVDATGKTLAVANYGNGTVATVRLDDEGLPVEIVSEITPEGGGPNKERQSGPHAHGVYFNRGNDRLYVPDLGLDKVLVYPFDATSSSLGEPLPALSSAPGAGPRHITFSPDERHVYVLNELDNTLLAASHDAASGKMKSLAALPTLPKDFSAWNSTSEIEISADGRFVYASNRGHNSIAVFARDEKSGKPSFLQHAPCGGAIPRHFKIDPTGKWLLCGHEQSSTISILAIDPETGLLGEPLNTVSSPNPICILFPR